MNRCSRIGLAILDPSRVSDRFPSLASLVVQYCVIFVLEAETPSNIPGSFSGCGAGVELHRSRIPSWPYHRVPSLSVQFEQLMAWNPSVEKHGAGSQSCQRRVFFPWVGPNTTQGPVKIWHLTWIYYNVFRSLTKSRFQVSLRNWMYLYRQFTVLSLVTDTTSPLLFESFFGTGVSLLYLDRPQFFPESSAKGSF